MKMVRARIVCSECGEDTLLRREPVYEGFAKKGERFLCGSCGHEYADEAQVPFKEARKSSLFDGDRPKAVTVFKDGEGKRTCRHCGHYVVNPFIQRCGLTHREVEATDWCDSFEPAEEASS